MNLAEWLHALGLGRYVETFRESEITAEILPELTDADLREIGIPLGPRKLLLKAITSLRLPSPNLDSTVDLRSGSPDRTLAAAPPQAERRQLTVIFVDLVGSTALSTRLDPEDMRAVLHAYQNTVTGEIARVDGHVAKLMGDGVLAYFGWPRAHEDDPERAVRAALHIVSAVSALANPIGGTLAARVGIATGIVVVGDLVGEGAAQEEAVVGETPNLAARLQEEASPGCVVIAADTRRLLGEVFELRDVGALRLKGFPTPVNSYFVLGEQASSSRFESRYSGPALPMVGRDQELALILERWRQSVTEEGQAVLLVGEAGIGKSRLVQAILEPLTKCEHFALRYQCSPHHSGTALWPVIQQIEFAAGFEPHDDESTKVSKLESLLCQAVENVDDAVPLIASLLDLSISGRYPPQRLTPHQQRARTLGVLIDQLLGLAGRRPVLMVVEDVHWVDPTTLELLGQVLDQITGARVLMLLTSRPDNQPGLGGHPHVTRLTLNRLGRGATEAIVSRLTGDSLPAETVAEIAARTDGIPLFVEELTKAVLEVGGTGSRSAVPASLHASLMARLDRVPDIKQVAQVGACIGREFSYPLLAAVSSLSDAELQSALARLTSAELVFRRGTPPEASYTFKHALVRDAAHESLLKSDRQRLHSRIVQVIEERFPETVAAEPEMLAQHCAEAGQVTKSIDYWHKAGGQALARFAMTEAIGHLNRGLRILQQIPEDTESRNRELGLQLALGQASIAAKGFAALETGRAYARARQLCGELGSVSELFPVLYGQSVFHFQRGELTRAHEVSQELLEIAEAHGDIAARVTGHRMIGSSLCQLGRFAESREQFEAALGLYDPVRDRNSGIIYAIDSRVMSLSWLSHLDLLLGDPEQALSRDAKVSEYAALLAQPNTTAVALVWGCIFRQLLHDRPGVLKQAEEVIELASDQGFPLYEAAGMVLRGWALSALESEDDEGIKEIRRGLTAYAATGAAMWSPYFLGLFAERLGACGRPETGLEVIGDALDQADEIKGRWIEAELHRLKGGLLLRRSAADQDEAEVCFDRALVIAREQSARWWELRSATSLALLLREQGRRREAREALVPIYAQFGEGCQTPDLRRSKALLTSSD